jgi:hypothetical protein
VPSIILNLTAFHVVFIEELNDTKNYIDKRKQRCYHFVSSFCWFNDSDKNQNNSLKISYTHSIYRFGLANFVFKIWLRSTGSGEFTANYCKPPNFHVPFIFATSEICEIKRPRKTKFNWNYCYTIFKMLHFEDCDFSKMLNLMAAQIWGFTVASLTWNWTAFHHMHDWVVRTLVCSSLHQNVLMVTANLR